MTELLLERALGGRDRGARRAVEQTLDVLLLDDIANVGGVRICRDVFPFDREVGTELDTGLDSGEKESDTERTATGEGVEKTDCGISVGEVGSVLPAEDCLVGGATGTAQLPAPSTRRRTCARCPRAAPTLARPPDVSLPLAPVSRPAGLILRLTRLGRGVGRASRRVQRRFQPHTPRR
jgi:hypothetical protein